MITPLLQLGDEGAESLAKDLVSSAFRFVRVAANDISVSGGCALADALDASEGMNLLDVTFNSTIAYQDIVRIKLHNNLNVAPDGENPLDMGGRED